jgi:PAS domain S-box-containing protein
MTSTDEQQRHREETMQALLNATGESIYGLDLDGNCTFANPSCVRILGCEQEDDLLGHNMHDLIHHTRPNGEHYPVEDCRIYQAYRAGEQVHVQDEIVWRPDGTSFAAEYWSDPIFIDGEIAGCVVAFVDITERQRAQEELRESEEKVHALLNATGQGIYGADLDGNCTFANPACVQMLGCESDEDLLGKNMHNLIHHTRANGEPYPMEECKIYQSFREGQGVHCGDEIVWRDDGTSFPAEYWSHPLHIRDELVGCVVVFTDITERKRADQELHMTEKLSALGKLSAGLAHELNNPAAAAQRSAAQLEEELAELERKAMHLSGHGFSEEQWAHLDSARKTAGGQQELSALDKADREDEMIAWLQDHDIDDPWDTAAGLVTAGFDNERVSEIAKGVPKEALSDALRWLCQSQEVRELVRTVATSARSISELVGAVKEYSYMDRAPKHEIDIHDGIENTLRVMNHKLKAGTKLVREFDTSLPPIFVPVSELNQVWTNLLDNAIDAAGPEGEVRISTSLDDGHIVVKVADNGGGIPLDIQSKIFDPFFTTKDVGEGTGLGLDVVRRIVVERCGGDIDVESKPGDTRFRIRIPLQRTSDGNKPSDETATHDEHD